VDGDGELGADNVEGVKQHAPSSSSREQRNSPERSVPTITTKTDGNNVSHQKSLGTAAQAKNGNRLSSPGPSSSPSSPASTSQNNLSLEPLKQSQSSKDEVANSEVTASIEIIRKVREQTQTAFVSTSSPAAVTITAGGSTNAIHGNNAHRLGLRLHSQTQNNPQVRKAPQSQDNTSNAIPARQRSLPLRLSTSHTDTIGTISPRIQPQLQTQPQSQSQPPPNTSNGNAKKTSTMIHTSTAPTKKNLNLPTTMSLTTPWARKFILSRPRDALLPIPREYLSDGFNLVQLAPVVERAVTVMNLRGKDTPSHIDNVDVDVDLKGSASSSVTATAKLSNVSLYKAALKLILETEEEGSSSSGTMRNGLSAASIANSHSKYTPFQIQKAAEVLYTLVHARYVTSPRGLDTIRRMFKRNALASGGIEPIFGRCSRLACGGMPLLPIGISDRYDIGGKGGAGRKAMRFCPSCRETFFMWDSKIDGAAWGTSFCNLFLMAQGSEVFGEWWRKGRSAGLLETVLDQPRPKVFGFPIHPAADMNKMTKGLQV